MFGFGRCTAPRRPEDSGGEEEEGVEKKGEEQKEWTITSTNVELSEDGRWLRAVEYSLFFPVTSVSSIRVRSPIDRKTRDNPQSRMVYLEIIINAPNLAFTEVAGTLPPTKTVYAWTVVSDPMEYSRAADLMTRLTGFTISRQVPPVRGPVMP